MTSPGGGGALSGLRQRQYASQVPLHAGGRDSEGGGARADGRGEGGEHPGGGRGRGRPGERATAKASRVGPAAISQGYGQSYSSSDPAWTTPGATQENLERVTDVSGTTDYGYQGDRATTLSGALTASIAYDFAGRATSRVAAGLEVEGFVHDTLDRLTQVRRNNGALSEVLEYAPTGELLFRKLGTQGTWYVGSVGTVTATVAAGCTGVDTIAVPVASRCSAVAGTVKVSAHVQVAGGRVASIRAAAGSGTDAVSEVLYYHRDMQGSVVATTMRTGGLSGAMGARYRYTPYGQLDRAENVTALSDSELGYTGGFRLGYAAGAAQQGSLVLLGARVYHAELKRWLVPDTVDGRRYTYAGGDPVNFVDPGGRMPIEGGGGGGGVGGGGSQTIGGGGLTANPGLQAMMMAADEYPPCGGEVPPGTDYCRMPGGELVDLRCPATGRWSCSPGGGGGGNSRPPPGSMPPEPGGGGGGRGGGGGGPAEIGKTRKDFLLKPDWPFLILAPYIRVEYVTWYENGRFQWSWQSFSLFLDDELRLGNAWFITVPAEAFDAYLGDKERRRQERNLWL